MLVTLKPTIAEKALDATDAIEGVSAGLFQRVIVTTKSGERCWTYHWPASIDGFDGIPVWS